MPEPSQSVTWTSLAVVGSAGSVEFAGGDMARRWSLSYDGIQTIEVCVSDEESPGGRVVGRLATGVHFDWRRWTACVGAQGLAMYGTRELFDGNVYLPDVVDRVFRSTCFNHEMVFVLDGDERLLFRELRRRDPNRVRETGRLEFRGRAELEDFLRFLRAGFVRQAVNERDRMVAARRESMESRLLVVAKGMRGPATGIEPIA